MQESKFLIIGLDGVGAEIAKNLILTGSYVTICDNQKISELDLYVNPFIRKDDVNKQRDICLKRLQELNPAKEVKWIKDFDIQYDNNTKFNTIIYCNQYNNDKSLTLLEISKIARQNNIKFISATQFSLVGQIFVDFGDKFLIQDQDGERYEENIVSELMLSKEGIFIIAQDQIQLSAGDIIKIKGIEMQNDEISKKFQDLINNKQFKVLPTSSKILQLVLDDNIELLQFIQEYGNKIQYLRGGDFIKIKIPRVIDFQPYEQQIQQPFIDQNIIDFSKMDQQEKVFSIIKQHNFNQQIQGKDNYEKYIQLTQQSQFSPMCSIIGSWASQEALKSVTGQYTPIFQFAIFDCMEIVDFGNNIDFSSNSFNSQNNIQQLFDSIKLENNQLFSDILKKQNTFIVGAGALGCEIVKHFALNRIDNITVTDNDRIENSNLSRQFLFREENNHQYKSEVAIQRWKEISQLENGRFLTEKISMNNPLPCQFWKNQTIVVNALDNVNARKFVDSKCIEFDLPLLESGTLGSKANMQVIIPHLTKTYGETQDPESKEEALCLLHNNPTKISHCIQYAQNQFVGIFENGSAELLRLKKLGVDEYLNYMKDNSNKTQQLSSLYDLTYPLLSDSLENGAMMIYNRYFVENIQHLLDLNPLDSKNANGSLFWSGDKHPPKVIPFSQNIQYCNQFVDSYKTILGQIIDNPQAQCQQHTIHMLSQEQLASQINTNDDFVRQIVEDAMNLIKDKELHQLSFEKDIEELKHVQFLSAFSNLRAMNYGIQTVEDEEIRRIAGKIIPAIITTTSAIVGHVMIEYMKLVLRQGKCQKTDELSFYKSIFMNLALPMCQIVENEQNTQFKCGQRKIDNWEKFYVDKEMTIQNVIDKVKQLYDIELDGITYGVVSLFMSFMCKDFNQKLGDILTQYNIHVNKGEQIMCTCIPEEDDDSLPNMILYGF